MLSKIKKTKKGSYNSLSSKEKEKIISMAMQKTNEDQINLMKEFDRKFALKEQEDIK